MLALNAALWGIDPDDYTGSVQGAYMAANTCDGCGHFLCGRGWHYRPDWVLCERCHTYVQWGEGLE
ncbi:hypothetical protein TPY_3215 [Sulfobacillus acidophilus TPY]|uniref:Uncharacterized protein n=1 Tax=Sulfobacillus acidophilus (strain ATCC 700253 / DSM 10332 / NAL) TaxID=679936 RepID=G8TZF4_SULAD|nr:hypothetical protein TPY_3215 [Sulfobacillus acidophilus TPY]AEW05194.1 hypothetical protein Sulac_1698 [Sulfobacillus acidophilus DSM 10332]